MRRPTASLLLLLGCVATGGCHGFDDAYEGWWCQLDSLMYFSGGGPCSAEWNCENNAPLHLGDDTPESLTYQRRIACGGRLTEPTETCECFENGARTGEMPLDGICALVAEQPFERLVQTTEPGCNWAVGGE